MLGKYIALIGPNGAGKSHHLSRLKKKLESDFKVSTFYAGRFQFKILPLNWLLKKIKPSKVSKGPKPNSRKREVREFNQPLVKYIAPIIYYFEYLLRYFFIVLPRQMSNDYVLVDRDFIDLTASPNAHTGLVKVLDWILPGPKRIVLEAPATVLFSRRQELPKEELARQLAAYHELDCIARLRTDKKGSLEALHEIILELRR
jgi:hypothetical protein